MSYRESCRDCGRPKANVNDWKRLSVHMGVHQACPDECGGDLCWHANCGMDVDEGTAFTARARELGLAWRTTTDI